MKIAILGTGRMGAFFAEEFTKVGHQVAVMDRDLNSIPLSPHWQQLRVGEELADFAPELLLNAVSLQNTVSAFREIAPSLSAQTVLVDIASIKGELADYYPESGHQFASLHPMFGPTFASANQLAGHHCIVISGSDSRAVMLFRGLLESRGVTFSEVDFIEHDRMMAYSLAVPFMSSLVFAGTVDRTAVPGTTFRRHCDTAEGLLSEDDHLLAEILFAPGTMPQLEKITGRLEFLKHIIRQKDLAEFRRYLAQVRKNFAS